MKKYYHATNIESLDKIIKDNQLGEKFDYQQNYGDKGLFITDDPDHAETFGSYIFIIDSGVIDENKFYIDDSFDGIFYKDFITLDNGVELHMLQNDRTTFDIFNRLIENVGGDKLEWLKYCELVQK